MVKKRRKPFAFSLRVRAAPTMSSTSSRQERYATRTIDIIVHGATGFTGKRVATHLASKHPELNVAICGRNQDKLNAVANELGWDKSKCKSLIFVVSNIVDESDKLVAAFFRMPR